MVPAVLLGANWLRYQCGFANTVDEIGVDDVSVDWASLQVRDR